MVTPLSELLANYRRLAAALPEIIALFPNATVVGNGTGNLAILVRNGQTYEDVGYIDVRTGNVIILE
jgi:hypothetical protein